MGTNGQCWATGRFLRGGFGRSSQAKLVRIGTYTLLLIASQVCAIVHAEKLIFHMWLPMVNNDFAIGKPLAQATTTIIDL